MRHPPLYWHYSLEKREEELLPAQLDSTTTMRLGAYFFTYSVSDLTVGTHTKVIELLLSHNSSPSCGCDQISADGLAVRQA